MSVIYADPPLLEAICDFRFVPGPQPWGLVIPGLMYDRIRDEYPMVQDQPAVQMLLASQSDPVGAPQFPGSVSRVQFFRVDGAAVVQVGPNVLSVNHLRPYSGWKQFMAMILHHLDIYVDIARPLGLAQLQLRYINKMEIPQNDGGEPLDVNKYCTVLPTIPDALNRWVSGFLQRIEIAVPGSQSRLVVQSGSVPAGTEGYFGLLVDLEYTIQTQQPLALGSAENLLVEAHAEIERAFNECFTPFAKEIFGGGPDD